MHDEKLTSAVEILVEQLTAQLQEVSETKKTINGLCRRMGKEPMFADVASEQLGMGSVRPDQYYGRPLATVASEYLERRKQACQAEEIMRGLIQGGFDFKSLDWQEKDWLRHFAISLAKNSQTFHKLPNGTFGLASWYPEAARRKREEAQGRAGAASKQEKEIAPADDPTNEHEEKK